MFPKILPKEAGSYLNRKERIFLKKNLGGFPGGSVVKTLSANAGDASSICDPGRSHMLQGN